jgi:hypothetical protein
VNRTNSLLLVFALLLIAGAGAFYWRRSATVHPVPSTIEPAKQTPDAAAIKGAIFKQNDPRWANDEIGGSREKLGNVGCTVCCVAMLFVQFGIETTPAALNDWLKAHGGYTDQGLLIWEKCAEYSGGRAVVDYKGEADRGRIDRSLAAGTPVIVKVMAGSVPHWVLIAGKSGGEYMVDDPLGPEQTAVGISRFGPDILALRVFRKIR